MFVEVNFFDAADHGIKDGGWVWVFGPENLARKARVKALVTERVGKGVAWMPFHFGGWFQNVDQRGKYPPGNDPIVLGESVNTLTTYGYDPATGMHEGKGDPVPDPNGVGRINRWLASNFFATPTAASSATPA